MGLCAISVDYEKAFEHQHGNYLFLNDFHPQDDRVLIDKLTLTSYQDSTFTIIPSCQCGSLNKRSKPEAVIGDRCEYCLTKMVPHTSRKLEPTLWVRGTEYVPKFISPRFLSTLMACYKTRNKPSTIIHWLLDPYEKQFGDEKQIAYMEAMKIERGIAFFLKHSDYVMEHLNNPDIFGGTPEQQQLYLVYQQDKEVLFPSVLPITDKSFNIVERSHLGNYLDLSTFNPYLSSINLITGMNTHRNKDKKRYQESTIARFLFKLVEYYENYISGFHNSKPGEYRKQVYGSRLPWTTRQVIVSITEEHDFDEIHMPWGASIALLEHHITNHLFKRGYTLNEVKDKIYYAINNYDEEISEILDTLIEESPHRTTLSKKPGLILLDNRNPSLKQASIQAAIVTKIKRDPKDISCARSVLTNPGMNSDHDGEIETKN